MSMNAPGSSRVGRQTGLWLKDEAHRADGRQAAVAARGGQNGCIVDARYPGCKDVRLEAVRVEQVILEELAGIVCLGESRHGQKCMRTPGLILKPIFERRGQVDNVSTVANGKPVLRGARVRVARWRRVLRVDGNLSEPRWEKDHEGQQRD